MEELTKFVNEEMGLSLSPDTSMEALRLRLCTRINEMITGDFQQLVNILYRVDVNERKLKYLLHENVGEDAAGIIAGLIIDRQMEKIASRQQFRQNESDINDDERW